MKQPAKTVMGVDAPAPRITGRAVWLALIYLPLPLIAGLVTFDVVVWWVAERLWGVCIGLWCLF